MLKIGEFSKLSQMTIKTLRFYEKEGILIPVSVDPWTGYRYYETNQLILASKIKAYRQMDLSIEDIKDICSGADEKYILNRKLQSLNQDVKQIESRISVINHILEDNQMDYKVTEKAIPKCIVYYSEKVLKDSSEKMEWIPSLGAECLKLNPDMKCQEPEYEFCEYLDNEYRETDIRIRHNEAVLSFGKENETIHFKELPEAKVLSIYHKGSYETISDAYAYIMNYAEKNSYEMTGPLRERYIDGIWNKESEEEWLTEIQLPVK